MVFGNTDYGIHVILIIISLSVYVYIYRCIANEWLS